MDNQRLVQELVEAGFMTATDGENVIRDTVSFGKSAEEIIMSRNLATEQQLAEVKSKILDIPYAPVSLSEIKDEVLQLIPEETAKTYKVVPLSRDGATVVVGMVHPDDPKTQEMLRFIAKKNRLNLGAYIITPSDLSLVLRKYSPFENTFQAALRTLNVKPQQKKQSSGYIGLEEQKGQSEDAPVIKIVASIMKEAVNLKASDVHIEPQRSRLRVRFRIDGELQEISSMPLELHQPVISRIKIMSDLKIDENRVPQDGRFRTEIFGKEIDFRVSTFPTPTGEKVAIRVLDPETGLRTLDDLGLVGKNRELVLENVKKPYGMVLITGPTGSGKTTTLYAIMQQMNAVGSNIVSLEDPVEYTLDGVNQSQVRPEIGYTFASGLRQILRQDPDVILVGEIRDSETAELAVHAALTGHIVLSTLHTNNSLSVIPRLIDMKVEPFLLPSALNLMAAQRLISKICQKCKEAKDPTPAIKTIIEKEMARLPEQVRSAIKPPYKVYSSKGCEACKNRGVSGRVAIFEMLQMTPQMTEVISAGVDENKIQQEAQRQGMITLRQDGILKALQGLIKIEDVLRETEEV